MNRLGLKNFVRSEHAASDQPLAGGSPRDGDRPPVTGPRVAAPSRSDAQRAQDAGRAVAVSIRDLSLWYGPKQALFGVDLDVPRNQVTALIGPSGCGKSTLLRSINRMNDLVEGVRIEGRIQLEDLDVYSPAADVIDIRKRCGMVFQRSNPFPKTIFENVVFGLRIDGERRRSVLEEAAERALRQAALWDEAKDRLDESALALSGGQQQRLCIARAIATRPEVVLMDEPASALDPISTARIEELIADLARDYTIVIVTHNMQQAARVSDRTAFMLNGELVEVSDTETMFTSPTDSRTEDYLTGRFG